MASPAIKAFNSGVYTPLLYGRTDLEKYTRSCKQLYNMIPLIQGGATRRPGTEYINEAHKDSVTGDTYFGRLIPFSRSNDISYMLEFGDNYIRVYYNGVLQSQGASLDAYSATESYKPGDWVDDTGSFYCIQAGIGNATSDTDYWLDTSTYQVWTPWTKEEVKDLQYVQSIDVMYIIHPDHEVHKLSSSGVNNFTLEKVDFVYQAFLDENIDTTKKVGVYAPHLNIVDSGTTDGTVANKLDDSTQNFTSTVKDGDLVYNSTDNTYATVTNVDSNTRLTLSEDIMVSGEDYTISEQPAPALWIDGINYPEGAKVYYGSETYEADRDISEYEDYTDPSNANAPWTAYVPAVDDGLSEGSLLMMKSEIHEFALTDVGKYILMKVPREDTTISEKLNLLDEATESLDVFGDWHLITHGTWTGKIQLQRSYDDGVTWVLHRTYTSVNDANHDDTGTEEVANVKYRAQMTDYTSGSATVDISIEAPYNHDIYKIVDFTDANTVTVQTTKDMTADPVNILDIEYYSAWSEGAWGGNHGYPRAITIFEERLCLSGNEKKPNTIWTSRINDYENLTSGVLDTDAIIYTPSSEKVFKTNWLVSSKVLLIGTDGDEWALGGSKTDEAMSPTNLKASRQSNFGSEYIQPLLINTSVMYVQRGGRKIREMAYNWQEERYISNCVTDVGEHLFDSGIVNMAFMHNPHPILWVLLENGQWTGFTYEREQDVYAWHLHEITGFDMKSVAVIPGDDNNDEFWLAGETLYSNDYYTYICRMADFNYDEVYDEYNGDTYDSNLQLTTPPFSMSSAWFFDYARQKSNGNTVQVLDGQTGANPYTFDITGHGFVNGNKVMCNTDINWEDTYDNSYVGQVFTIADVSGSTFSLKTEVGTEYFTGTESFNFHLLRLVDNTMTIQLPWRGKELKSITDGKIDYTIAEAPASGTITFDAYSDKQLVGIPFASRLQPMEFEAELADGASQGRTKRISKVIVRFFETIGCDVKTNDGDSTTMKWRKDGDIMNIAPTLYSGYKQVYFKDGFDKHADVILETDTPYPMTVLLMQVWINTYQ